MRKLTVVLAVLLFTVQSRAGTVTGVEQNAQQGPLPNATFTFTLTQAAVVSGTASVVPSSVNCYTDSNGNVVGLPTPLSATLSVNLASGTLPGGTYYIRSAWNNTSGTTQASAEQVQVLASSGTLIITPPTNKQPGAATQYNVYIGTTSGGETLQGTVSISGGTFAAYSQSTPLIAGSALPASNTSVCSLRFNDELQPSFVCYNVGLTTQTGAMVSGYPQYFYLAGGSSGTVNLSTGTPSSSVCQGSGVVYPQAIVTTPAFNGLQSINGPLSLNGFGLTAGTVTTSGAVSAPQFNKKVYLDGTTNTTVQATINAAAALGCAEAHIPAGTYTLDSTVLAGGNTIPSCISLVGDGADKTILVYKNTVGSGAGYDPIENSSLAGGNNTIAIRDLTIDGSQLTSGTSRCIYFKNVTKFWIQRVHLTGCQTHGFMADDGTNQGWADHNTVEHIAVGTAFEIGNTPLSAVVNNIWVTDNWINDTGANGVFSIGSKVASAYGNSGIHADRNTCTGVKDTCVEIGASTQDSTANGNTVFITTAPVGGSTGIGIRSTKNVTASGNTVNCNSQVGAVGMLLWSQGVDNTTSQSNSITGNTIQNCPIGIKSTGNSGQIDGLMIKNNQFQNNTTNYSPAGTETHLGYCGNSDNLCDINDGYTFDEGPIVASSIASQLKIQAVQGGQVGILFRENDVALPNGLWRITMNGDAIIFNKNTAAGGDFSTNFSFMSVGTGTTGTVTFGQGLVTAGQGLKVNTSVSNNGTGLQHVRITPGCATAAAAGATCTTTITWPTAFANANYTVTCTGGGITSGIPVNGGFSGRGTTSVNFITVAATAAAAQYSEVDCEAMHD